MPDQADKSEGVVRGPNIMALPEFAPLPDVVKGEVLLKLGDNISTDDIQPAGVFLPLRSNVPEISKFVFEVVDSQFPARAQEVGGGFVIGGDNYGQGSSREHAPWALLDFGFRCIIAPSFADIFYNNCFKNGILPITLPQEEIDKLIDDASRGDNARLTIDLEAQEIRGPDGGSINFDIDPHRKRCLLEGLDDIGLTLEKAKHIEEFERDTALSRPWS